MQNTLDLSTVQVIDSDTHVIEPKDLWTSRLSAKKWGDLIPHVKTYSGTDMLMGKASGIDAWYCGDTPLTACGMFSMAGWPDYLPNFPPRYEDFAPTNMEPTQRLSVMDAYGIHTQILYPNVGIFAAESYLGTEVSPEFALECIQAYNDFLVDWASVAPGRYVPMMTLPFWDLEASGAEMDRCIARGHKGIVMSSRPENFGLAGIGNAAWDPLWAQAQDLELPINFHIGSGKMPVVGDPASGLRSNLAFMGAHNFMGNVYAIGSMIMDGVCHRFPRLNVVSVESGIGWIPFLLEALDWQWKNNAVRSDNPAWDMLPSEYFLRQIYGCFWFEETTGVHAIEALGPDNFLFETDFPHPTSMSPGPASVAKRPLDYFSDAYGGLSAGTQRKLLHDNAARIYHLP